MDSAVCEVQAPTVGRDKLNRAIANFTSPKIESVEGSIRRDYVKNAGAAIGNRSHRDPVWTKERALVYTLTRKHDRAESMAPHFFARLRVECKYGSSNPRHVNNAADAPECRNIRDHDRRC